MKEHLPGGVALKGRGPVTPNAQPRKHHGNDGKTTRAHVGAPTFRDARIRSQNGGQSVLRPISDLENGPEIRGPTLINAAPISGPFFGSEKRTAIHFGICFGDRIPTPRKVGAPAWAVFVLPRLPWCFPWVRHRVLAAPRPFPSHAHGRSFFAYSTRSPISVIHPSQVFSHLRLPPAGRIIFQREMR